jgi:hypothetical protein
MGKASDVIRSKFIYIVGMLLIILLLLALIIFTPLIS